MATRLSGEPPCVRQEDPRKKSRATEMLVCLLVLWGEPESTFHLPDKTCLKRSEILALLLCCTTSSVLQASLMGVHDFSSSVDLCLLSSNQVQRFSELLSSSFSKWGKIHFMKDGLGCNVPSQSLCRVPAQVSPLFWETESVI